MHSDILQSQFLDAIADCRLVYVDKAVECVVYKSGLSGEQQNDYLDEIQFSFNRLLVKVFVEVAFSDCVWSSNEAWLAQVLMEELLRKKLDKRELKNVLDDLYQINSEDSWQSVLEPFTLLDELIEFRPELESGLMRIANIVAKVDGKVTEQTIGQLKNIQWQIRQFLSEPRQVDYSSGYAARKQFDETWEAGKSDTTVNSAAAPTMQPAAAASVSVATEQQQQEESKQEIAPVDQQKRLEIAMAQLDELIGIEAVKDEVKGLVNFLKVQTARAKAGLPENPISLHMVFAGNPGTGKTTVARLLGHIFGAMGVLEKGHLIETDRSGLVAEYVGQTAAKANQIIDSALDGVMFIDEAYSLVGDSKDTFGAEAMQILLKRAEDERDRLIVILAGYSQPMQKLLKTNPGLTSRFSRTFDFPDYSAEELCQIFEILSSKNHYNVAPDVRLKIQESLLQHVADKDQHFGNGRLVRNMFEQAMRRLADRVVDETELTPELLTTFQISDLQF